MSVIASDTSGEHHAFGTTVQHLACDDPPALLRSKIEYLIHKMAESHKAYCDDTSDDDGVPSCTIPMPVTRAEGSPPHLCTSTALVALGILARELDDNGMAVINVSPVCLQGLDPDINCGQSIAIGFRVQAALKEHAQRVLDRYEETSLESTWCEQAFEMYGDAAIKQMKQRLLDATADPETTH